MRLKHLLVGSIRKYNYLGAFFWPENFAGDHLFWPNEMIKNRLTEQYKRGKSRHQLRRPNVEANKLTHQASHLDVLLLLKKKLKILTDLVQT